MLVLKTNTIEYTKTNKHAHQIIKWTTEIKRLHKSYGNIFLFLYFLLRSMLFNSPLMLQQ